MAINKRTTEDQEDKQHYGTGEKVPLSDLVDRVIRTIKQEIPSEKIRIINNILGTKYKTDDVMLDESFRDFIQFKEQRGDKDIPTGKIGSFNYRASTESWQTTTPKRYYKVEIVPTYTDEDIEAKSFPIHVSILPGPGNEPSTSSDYNGIREEEREKVLDLIREFIDNLSGMGWKVTQITVNNAEEPDGEHVTDWFEVESFKKSGEDVWKNEGKIIQGLEMTIRDPNNIERISTQQLRKTLEQFLSQEWGWTRTMIEDGSPEDDWPGLDNMSREQMTHALKNIAEYWS